MTWATILVIAAGGYFFKAAGAIAGTIVGGHRAFVDLAALVPPALLSALVITQTFADGTALVIDARLAGVLVGAVAAWRRAPFVVVVVVAGLTAAALRLAV